MRGGYSNQLPVMDSVLEGNPVRYFDIYKV